MVTIFVPIYLYKLHYSIRSIMIYFMLASVFWGITQGPILRWSNKIGFNRAMALGLIGEGLQILMFATISVYHWPLWLIALVWGIAISLYWPQFRASFVKSLLHRKVAPAVGISSALLMLALGIAPAIGGVIASWFGIITLYIVAMLCFAAAAGPLFAGGQLIKKESYNLREIAWRKIWRDLVANMGSEVDAGIAANVWPLFIFLIIPSYVGVGVLSSIAVIASIVIAFYAGRRKPKEITSYLRNGAGVIGLTNAVRLIGQSAGQIAGINFFNGLGQALVVTPYYSRYYSNAEHEPLIPYVYAMMMACVVGDVLTFGLLALLSEVTSVRVVLAIGLIIGIPAGYAVRLIRTPRTASA